MKELFYELINEAVDGKVKVFGDLWPVGFNTKILEDNKEKVFLNNDNNKSMLYIIDEEKFFQKLDEYFREEIRINRKTPAATIKEEKDKWKWIMMYLFAYATTEDFLNPIEYISKRIDFLKDNTFKELDEGISIPLESKLSGTNLVIRNEKSPVSMETPNRLIMELHNDNNVYHLPSIYYAIRKENNKKVCYIYSILKKEAKNIKDEDKKYQKKINRLLFKINDGVTDTEEYNYDGEANIKDVSMSFIFSLNIFISLLQRKGIDLIKAVPYLPVSYNARDLTAIELDKEELRERNNRIQENQTNKFIRTFRRLSYQNDSLQVVSYPYEVDEFLTMKLSPREKELDNMLLEETNKKVVEERTRLL